MPVGPHPIGYVEIQKAIPPEGTPDRAVAIDRALREALAEATASSGRPMEYMGARLELPPNGTVAIMYCSYQPAVPDGQKRTPVLDPRNMNEAPQRVIGQLSAGMGVGMKEQRFGLGVPNSEIKSS